jgi:hypothetical protein
VLQVNAELGVWLQAYSLALETDCFEWLPELLDIKVGKMRGSNNDLPHSKKSADFTFRAPLLSVDNCLLVREAKLPRIFANHCYLIVELSRQVAKIAVKQK